MRGVAIISRNKYVTVNKYIGDHEGRYVLCNVTIEECQYTLLNIYAPNEDFPGFFERIS